MKRLLSNKITWLMEAVYRKIILYVPCFLLGFFVFDYYTHILNGTYSVELFERVSGGVKIAATTAALGFYAGYMTTEEKKKPKFYENGEQLFHATILLLVVNMLQNFILNNQNFNVPPYILGFLFILIKGCLLIFITYATYCMMSGITGLLKVLHWEHEELLRSHRNGSKGEST